VNDDNTGDRGDEYHSSSLVRYHYGYDTLQASSAEVLISNDKHADRNGSYRYGRAFE
jgi:hypothetical protein